MPFVNDRVFDEGLSVLDTEATRLDLTSQEATTYTEATSTYTLCNKTSISITAPEDRTGGGRKVVLEAITDGNVTGTGTVTHYAITDTNNSRLLLTGALNASQVVTSGNTFSVNALDIGIPDPT